MPGSPPVGRAAMVIIDLENPDVHGAMWAVFAEQPEDEPHQHPIARARALWESTKDDWPTHTLTIAANQRAENLRAAYQVSAMLGTDYAEALATQEQQSPSEAA